LLRKAADKKAEDDSASVTYHEIEMQIYSDSTTFKISNDYKNKFQIKGKDEGRCPLHILSHILDDHITDIQCTYNT